MRDLDLAKLREYLQQKMPQARNLWLRNLVRFPSGASKQTWGVDAVWDEDGKEASRGLVIRRNPPSGGPLDTTVAVEFRLYQKLWSTPVPVPKVLWLEEDTSWLGSAFYIMERIDNAQTDLRLLVAQQYAHLREKLARQVAQILAHSHNLDWQKLGIDFLGEAPAPDECAQREVSFWEDVLHREQLEPKPGLEAAFLWMKRNLPPPAQRISIIHGDYRNGNYLYNDNGDILAFLDWELAHLGDPLEDVGWIMKMSFARGEGRLPHLVPREQYIRWYEEFSGIQVDPDAVFFWEVFANVKTAVILLTGGWRYCLGLNSDIFQALIGRTSLNSELEALDMIGLT